MKWTFVAASLLISFSFFISPFVVGAAGFSSSAYKPFGGKIIMTQYPMVTCPGTGPILIEPFGQSLEGPYWATPGKGGAIRAGAWVLGLHNYSMDTSCQTDTTPPVSYSAYKWFIYGTSR